VECPSDGVGHSRIGGDRVGHTRIGGSAQPGEERKGAGGLRKGGKLIIQEQEYAPTTLPSHLLALLTAPSARAIVVVMEEFDLFTEHARQALLYCLCKLCSTLLGSAPASHRGRS
jgi:origin recognition complex subunit 4